MTSLTPQMSENYDAYKQRLDSAKADPVSLAAAKILLTAWNLKIYTPNVSSGDKLDESFQALSRAIIEREQDSKYTGDDLIKEGVNIFNEMYNQHVAFKQIKRVMQKGAEVNQKNVLISPVNTIWALIKVSANIEETESNKRTLQHLKEEKNPLAELAEQVLALKNTIAPQRKKS